MNEIKKPTKRTFYIIKDKNGNIAAQGSIESNQVLTTGQPDLIFDTNPDNVFPAFPYNSIVLEGDVYSDNGRMIEVGQGHSTSDRINTDYVEIVAQKG